MSNKSDMESALVRILYQNQLFADGLESVLNHNGFLVFKKSITELQELKSAINVKTDLFIVEADWPFPSLKNIFQELILLSGVNSKILLITNLINRNLCQVICNSKIHAVILKRNSTEELIFGIKQVLDGTTYYSSLAASVLLKNNMESQDVKISNREKQILSLLAEMKTTEEISNLLSITKSTVKSHRRNLMQKFNAKNLLCLLRIACRENLLNNGNDFCECCYKKFIGI